MGVPSIACIGIIGKMDNLLYLAEFPPHTNATFEFSLALNSSLDILELRRRETSVDQDFGLLHALDERFAVYGWLTNTGVKFLVILDLIGNGNSSTIVAPSFGLRDSDLKPVFRALQTAYIKLLQNPFYSPSGNGTDRDETTGTIKNRNFLAEVNRIGTTWAPGVLSV